jgi:hypothetical protein
VHNVAKHNVAENEEEIEIEEARTSPPPPPEEPQAGNCFYFDICGTEPD